MMRLALNILALWLLFAAPAQADPVSAAIVGWIGLSGMAATVATLAINSVLVIGANLLASKLFTPKMGASAAQERQASVTSLNIGEHPREMIVGFAATGGSLVDATNFGGQYGTDRELLVVALADHLCEDLVRVWIGDTPVEFTGDGPVAGYNGQLEIYWRPGALDDAPWPEAYQSLLPCLETGKLKGVAKVAVIYSLDLPEQDASVFPQGRPTFLYEVKGGRWYDARKDSTVTGGDGAHRRDDPSTWEWSENAEVCRSAYSQGVYFPGQEGDPSYLLVGRGLSAIEAPPEAMIAAANICDEMVDDGAEGEERRYTVGGVIRSNQAFIDVEEMFAAAMAGRIIQPNGGVAVEPGQAKVPVEITDDDLVTGREIVFNRFKPDSDLINSIIPRYVEPAQRWQDHAAGIQRDVTDLTADGGPREESLSLSLVTRRSQAERIGAIRRAEARLERSAAIVLLPRFAAIEEADWIRWTSARWTGGLPVDFRVTKFDLDEGWNNALALEEVSDAVYDGIAGVTPTLPALPSTPPDALALQDVAAEAIEIEGDDGSIIPAIRLTWAAPPDPAVERIRAEVRVFEGAVIVPTLTDQVNAGTLTVTNGVAGGAIMQARLIPLGPRGRPVAPSAWFTVNTGKLISFAVREIDGMTPRQLMQRLRGYDSQAQSAMSAILETALRIIEERQAMAALASHNGVPVRRIVVDETESFDKADYSLLRRTNLMGLVTDDGAAFTINETTLKVSETETFAQYRSAVSASLGDLSAAVSTEITARTTADSALASSLSTVSTTVGGLTSSVSTLSSSVSGLSAEWVLTVVSGNRIAGIRTHAGATETSMLFMADQIGFTDGTSDFYPLTIAGGIVKMTGVEVDTIKANSIVTNSIVGGAVTDAAEDAQILSGPTLTGSFQPIWYTAYGSMGGNHLIDIMFKVANGGGSDAGIETQAHRSSSPFGPWTFLDEFGFDCRGAFQDQGVYKVFDQPGAGLWYYRFQSRTTAGSASPVDPASCKTVNVELKR